MNIKIDENVFYEEVANLLDMALKSRKFKTEGFVFDDLESKITTYDELEEILDENDDITFNGDSSSKEEVLDSIDTNGLYFSSTKEQTQVESYDLTDYDNIYEFVQMFKPEVILRNIVRNM